MTGFIQALCHPVPKGTVTFVMLVCTRRTNSARTFTELWIALVPPRQHTWGSCLAHRNARHLGCVHTRGRICGDFSQNRLFFQRVNLSCNENIQQFSARIQSSTQVTVQNWCCSRVYHPHTPPIPTARVPPSPTGPPQRTEINPWGPHLKASRPTGRSILHLYPDQTYSFFSRCSKNNPFPLEEDRLLEILPTGNNLVQNQRGRAVGKAVAGTEGRRAPQLPNTIFCGTEQSVSIPPFTQTSEHLGSSEYSLCLRKIHHNRSPLSAIKLCYSAI